MKFKLHNRILLACARYFMHQNRARKEHPICPMCQNFLSSSSWKWNKEDDLRNINAEAKKVGLIFEAIAGTFWFIKKTTKGQYVAKVDETNYLDVQNIKFEKNTHSKKK